VLAAIGEGLLRKIASDRCFYCGERVRDADVDHFVPFARYPRCHAHPIARGRLRRGPR
jgi:hypothetical protein